MAAAVPGQTDLDHKIVTADALHAGTAIPTAAGAPTAGRGADCVGFCRGDRRL